MFSKILIKLVDEAVVPAIMLIATRIVSVVLISKLSNTNYTIGPSGFEFLRTEDYIYVNSYSTLAMILMVSAGLLYSLVKSLVFHDTHVSPSLAARMFSLRLSSFMQTSFDVYSQGVIWLSYAYLLTLVSGIFVLSGFLYTWVFIVTVIVALVATYMFIIDVENELSLNSRNSKKEDVEEYVLTLGGVDEV